MTKGWFLGLLVILCSSCLGIKGLKNESQLYEKEWRNTATILQPTDVLSKSVNGNWQLRIKGNPYELGTKKGMLTEKLYQQQEEIFFDKVAHFVPNPSKQKKLLSFLKWYNRSILTYVPKPYKQEIFALSQFTNETYDFLGTKFERNLLLHSAHDIGHAMQDLMLVGCSSIALWDDFTEDGELLIGRNFDFYVNDAFAENKIVEFIQPKIGYNYASVTWPGMVGVVSGMNEKGLTITLNAGRSSIPLRGKTPVSIVARSILQHAANLSEAVALAQQFEVFVAESFLIGSAADNKAIVIEMSPNKFDVYEQHNGKLICTNHFQSVTYQSDVRNQEHIAASHSQYRFQKLEETFPASQTYQVADVLRVLRDVSGLQGATIGLGNEKALNQLMAHHAVIFQPQKLIMYVSNNPYQLGAFDAYDLKKVFTANELKPEKVLELPADNFLFSDQFKKYKEFRQLNEQLIHAIKNETEISSEKLRAYEQSNPELWLTHKYLGDYFAQQKQFSQAIHHYKLALEKEISSETEKKALHKQLKKLQKKI